MRTHRANAMVNPGEPGPTPDSPEKPATPAEGGAKPEENNGWFDNLWRKTQKDAEDTIKFIEEEHKKNVQKFEAAVDEIKTTAEEVVDGLQSQLEGRKSLKMLREEKVRGPPRRFFPGTHRACPPTAAKPPTRASRAGSTRCARPVHTPIQFAHPPFYTVVSSPTRLLLASSLLASTTRRVSRPSPRFRTSQDAAEAALARVQVKLVASSNETQAAEEELDAAGGASRAPSDVTRRAKVSRSALLVARSDFAAAQKALREREEAVKRAEVELANSTKERNLINLLFKRKLTPEEEEEQRKLLEESKRLDAVVTIQRNFRKAQEIRRAAARVAERRRKILAGCVSATKTVASFVLLYVALIFFGRFLAAAFGARRAAYEATTATVSDAWSRARALSPLDHGYVRYGIASKLEAGDAFVLRERNRALGDRVAALELELSAATTALDRTHDASPCGDCARDVAARIDAEERARVAEERAATLSAEVVSLRAAASRSEMLAAQSRDPKGGRNAETAARAPPDAGVSYSAQVAAAATAAASVTLEARVSEATAAARSATDEAEATKVEIEVLRNLIDEGFLPGGAGGKCWAEVADARAKAQITAASVASAEAKRNAEAMLSEKLTLYADARRDAERKSDAYRVELEALRAAAPELRLVADDADARADGRTDAGGRTDATDREHSRVVARTRKTVVGASRLVAAAKVASERVRDAATALRDAESRAEVRRVELETLRHLVAGNGTAGVIDRAERVVSELPGAAARAAEAADRRVAARLRAEEEARAQAETKAEVYRVELASLRAIEAERAEAEAEAEARGDETGRGFGHDRGRGSAKALAAEVRRLEKALAEASASASVAAATPEAASAAATAAATAAADAAAEADAARERTLDRAPLVRRVAARIVAWTLGESHETRDALRRRVVSLERRLVAMTRATAVGPGPACAAALTEALDATRRAEANAESLSVELDAARGVAAALRDGDDDAAADALIVAADKHRRLLTSERNANREALESCRGHAAAASQRAFVASKAAADASDLFERHKLRLAAESLEERRADAMRRSVRAVEAGADANGSEFGSEFGSESGVVSPPPSAIHAIDAAVAAVAEADARAVALASKLRDAERRWRLAPGTLDAYVSREYAEADAWLLCAATSALAVALTVVATRSVIPAYAAMGARLAVEKARSASARRGLEEARYDAEVQRDRAAAAEVATNEARAEAARHLYDGFDDGRHLGTVVDEMRANLRRTSEVNDALRKDNDWLRAKLRDTQEAQMAFLAAPAGGWTAFRLAHEERSAELLKLRSEVERLRSARLDASATAAAAVRADARKHPEESATSAGELTLGSPSFRTGMAAAREAAEREAAALRDEAETLRDANEKLLAQVARLGRDNDRLNEAQAETTVAELAARAELVRRNAALAREATRERKNKSKVFFAGAAACGAYAIAAGASFGIVGADIFTGAMGVSAVAVVTVAGVVSACFAAWAVVFSAPNADVRALALPVETVALVDEDDVVLADRATEGARLVADTDAMETMKNGDEGDEGGETSESPTAAAITAPTSPAMTAPASPAAPRRVSFDDVANPGTAGTAPPPPEDAPRNKVRLFDTDGEDEAANARRDAEIAKLRGELGEARADADRLRQSRNRLARRAEGMRDENEALTAARDEVMSQAETMSLARFARGATNAESAERERAEQRDRERREETLRRQLSNFRAANERLEEELAALRKRTDDAEAEAEAATAEASLYENPPEDSDARDGGASFPDAIDGDAYAAAMRRAAKAESALRPALDRAAKAESALPSALERAARFEKVAKSAGIAVHAAREEMDALTRAKAALEKEIKWLKESRERLLREVAALRSANGELERELKLSDERRVEAEGQVTSSRERASTLERNLADAEKRAEAAILANDTLERDLKAAEEAARRVRARGSGAEALRHALEDAEEAREATRVVVQAGREARDAAARLVEKTRAENVALARDLAEAREALLVAREEAEAETKTKSREAGTNAGTNARTKAGDEAEVGSPEADSPEADSPETADARQTLRRAVEHLSNRVKEGYVHETRLKRRLAGQLAEKDQGEKDAEAGGGVSEAFGASTSGVSEAFGASTVSSASTSGASSFSRASAERRHAARRRAVGVLVAATTLTEEMRADPLGTHRLWRLARAAIVSVSRVMTGSGQAAYNAFSDGAVSSSLALMAACPCDVDVQVSGCRIIASMVASPTMTTHARRAPSFAGGGALRASASALEYHAADAAAAKAAARAMWTAVHLGGRPAQHEMISARMHELVLAAMDAHAEDGSVLEACCGCLLATALGDDEAKLALDAAGARAEVRRTMRDRGAKGQAMRFGGAFVSLEEWLQGNEGNRGGRKIPNPAPVRKPKGLASGVTSKALEGL